MTRTRWRKIISDLWGSPTRTLLVVVSIAVGVFAVGAILGTSAIIGRDLNSSYTRANPSAASIYTSNFDDELVDAMRNVPGVAEAEGRADVSVRVLLRNGDRRQLNVILLPDNGRIRINQVWPQSGVYPPGTREISMERSSLDYLGFRIGDVVMVETPDAVKRQLRISGSVHYINLPPAQFAGAGFAFATMDTLTWLGGSGRYNELQITVADDPLNKAHIQRVAERVRSQVEATGRTVGYTYIPDPGKYPGDAPVQALLMLLGVLGLFALILSGFLVVNTVSALLARQTKQIGIMKAIGARGYQIAAMYLATVLGFGALSLIVGIPLGLLATRGLTGYMAGLLNFDVASYDPSPGVLAVQVAIGLGVPVLAAIWPVASAMTISIREALSSDAISAVGLGRGLIDRLLHAQLGIPRPVLMSLRNVFRRRGRLAITLTTLTLAGGVFIAVVSMRDSTVATLDDGLAYFNYDVELRLDTAYRSERLVELARSVSHVVATETLAGGTVRRVRADGSEGNNVAMLALPAETPLIRPVVVEGRWLLRDDENAIVVNTEVLKDEKDIKVGDEITLKVGLKDTQWQVVGVVKGVLTGPFVYASQPYYWRLTNNPGRSGVLWVVTDHRDASTQRQVANSLESAFKAAGMRPSSTENISFRRDTIQGQFDLITVFLMLMAVMLAFVGGLGLMGTMSLSVLDRSREIGVMRAIGAADGQVRGIFVVESVLIGLISWAISLVLSFPLSKLLSDQVGMLFIQSPFTYRFSLVGAVGWLIAVVVLAVIASVLPARAASRLTVRDVLAME